jgi:hypothetical protein
MADTPSAETIAWNAYRKALAGADGNTITKDTCDKAVTGALVRAVNDGQITMDDITTSWAQHLADDTDRKATRSGKDALKKVLAGEWPLENLLDDVVIPLRGKERCFFGDMNAELLFRADQQRYDNVRNAQLSFDEWRQQIWNRFWPHLQRGLTCREVIEEGLLGGQEDPADDVDDDA